MAIRAVECVCAGRRKAGAKTPTARYQRMPPNDSENEDSFDCPYCDRSFPSHRGRGAHQWQIHPDEPATPPGGNETRPCDVCGADVTRYRGKFARRDGVYCSRDCYATHLSNRPPAEHPHYTGAYDDVPVACTWCGGAAGTRKRYRAERQSAFFCDTACEGEYKATRTGPAANAWRGGHHITDAVRRTLGAQSWTACREEIAAAADGCALCGDVPDTYDIHHIVPLLCGGTHHSDLLMALCHGCHMRVERYTDHLGIPPVIHDDV